MRVPEQLRDARFGFVKLRGYTKAPFESGWQKKPYRFNDIERWIQTGNNYGVMGGEGELIIVDADTKRISDVVRSDLPKTFTVKTPKNGHHFYFLCSQVKKKIVLKKEKEHLGEIISFGSQVVGSGSIHPETKTEYQVFQDSPIITISDERLFKTLGEYLPNTDQKDISVDDLDIMTVLQCNGINLKQVSGQYSCAHPVHGSKTGMNLVVNPAKNVWKCFRCDSGGGTLMLIAVLEGIIDCADAKPGVLRGALFKEAVRIAENKYGFRIKHKSKTVMPTGLWNDEWNASRFVERFGDNVRNCDDLGGWHVWNGKVWELDQIHKVMALARDTAASFFNYVDCIDDKKIQDMFRKHIKQTGNESKLKAMTNVARSYKNISVKSNDFDSDSYLLNCQNGIVDLRSGKLMPHNPKLLLTKICNTHYDSEAECEEWLKFLNIIFKGNKDLIDFIQKAVGYALSGDVSHQVFFILHGDGANGKSTFVETIYKMLGSYAAITPTATLIAKKGNDIPNDVARLRGARFIVSSELERSKLLDEALVKRFTSDEPITARFLRQEFFEFKPTGKIFLSTNYKPTIKGTDDGIWRRIRLIPFEHKFEGINKIEDFAEKYLFSELPGILAWAVRGFLKLQKEGMKPPDIVMNATEEYKSAEDGAGAFLDEFCEIGDLFQISVSDLYDAFKENSDFYMKKKDFNDYLQKRGFQKIRRTAGPQKGRFFWKGIRLSEVEENYDERPY